MPATTSSIAGTTAETCSRLTAPLDSERPERGHVTNRDKMRFISGEFASGRDWKRRRIVARLVTSPIPSRIASQRFATDVVRFITVARASFEGADFLAGS